MLIPAVGVCALFWSGLTDCLLGWLVLVLLGFAFVCVLFVRFWLDLLAMFECVFIFLVVFGFGVLGFVLCVMGLMF